MDAQAISTALRDLSRALGERGPHHPVSVEPHDPVPSEDAPADARISPEALEEGIAALNSVIQPFNTKLSFSVDQRTGQTVIRVSDRETEKVIREVPPADLLKLAANLAEFVGVLVDERV